MSDANNIYDRQKRVYGAEAQKILSTSSVLISGLNGLGVEIAKNVILSGVKVVTLHDDKKAELADLSSQYYLTEEDVGKNRAEASYARLADLNPYVEVKAITSQIDANLVKKYKSVVIINAVEEELLRINKLCREANVKFIAADMNGVFSRAFVDVGNEHVISDADGEKIKVSPIHTVMKENPVIVKVLDEEPHQFYTDEYVTFSLVKGMTELNSLPPTKLKVLSNLTFSLEGVDGTKFSDYQNDGYATQVKVPFTIKHEPLLAQLTKPTFQEFDFLNFSRPHSLHAGFAALSLFRGRHNGRLPRPHNAEDAGEVVKLATELFGKLFGTDQQFEESTVNLLARTAAGNTVSVASVLGGIVAQEVIKVITSKFTPLQQWLYVEHLQIIPTPLPSEADAAPQKSRYDGQIAIIGKAAQEKLQNLKVFVVGAGAIGCEHLKNLALMGVACGPKGLAHVTDMDTIELSNLSRQFLFRQTDLQKPKSERACLAITKINPSFKTKVYTSKVGTDTEQVFNDAFWNSLDVICNALDNINSRLYVDQRCTYYRKPLLECGTLGTKGNTQDVIPYLTENYGASVDPPETGIPLCTVKNLPYLIEHTIEYVMGLFKKDFTEQPADASAFLRDAATYEQKLRTATNPLEPVQSLHSFLTGDNLPHSFEDCVAWARREFEDNFVNQIKQLLFNFPANTITKEGIPFWSGKNKLPSPAEFNTADLLHLQFIAYAAYLRAQVFHLPVSKAALAPGKGGDIIENGLNLTYIGGVAKAAKVPPFVAKSGLKLDDKAAAAIAGADDAGAGAGAGSSSSAEDDSLIPSDIAAALTLFASIPKPDAKGSSLKGVEVESLEFEKDDDSNHHIDFIVAASNLRAVNYGIPVADNVKIKGIAGKIIPAIATTTASIAGLAILELYKLTFDPDYANYKKFSREEKDKKVSLYRNWYLNLALNIYQFADPILPKPIGDNSPYTVWDSLEYKFTKIPTVGEIMERIKKESGYEVSMISVGVAMLYASFDAAPKREARLKQGVVDAIEKITNTKLAKGTNTIVLEILSDNDDELPTTKIIFPPI